MWASEAPCSSISKNQNKSFKSGHFYAKILLFRTHHLWNSTTEQIFMGKYQLFWMGHFISSPNQLWNSSTGPASTKYTAPPQGVLSTLFAFSSCTVKTSWDIFGPICIALFWGGSKSLMLQRWILIMISSLISLLPKFLRNNC